MLESIERESREIMQELAGNESTDYVLEANRKLKTLMQDVQELQETHPERESDLNAMSMKLKQHAEKLTNSILEPIEESTS